jgi:chorismate synthase
MGVKMIKYVSAGDSHGEMLVGILENVPAHLTVDIKKINSFLTLRKRGYGRGKRMQIESDKVHIVSGILRKENDSLAETTGAPIGMLIENRDYTLNKTQRFFTVPRPGHSDFAGTVKFMFENAALPSERTSARRTAMDVAAGALLLSYLEVFGVEIYFFTEQIGRAKAKLAALNKFTKEQFLSIMENDLLAPGKAEYDAMKSEIDRAIKNRDSVGGRGVVVVKNLPPGVGHYGNFLDMLDGVLAHYVMSVPSVKSVEIGFLSDFLERGDTVGSKFHDALFIENGKITRKTNNAGGTEGGLSNGEDLIIRIGFKPIPTVLKGMQSVDLQSMKELQSAYVRSDTCVIPAGTVVSAMRVSIALSGVFSEQFGGDTIKDAQENFREWLSRRQRFWKK